MFLFDYNFDVKLYEVFRGGIEGGKHDILMTAIFMATFCVNSCQFLFDMIFSVLCWMAV